LEAHLTSVVGILATVIPYHLPGNKVGDFAIKDQVVLRLLLPHALFAIQKVGEVDLNIRSATRLMQVVASYLSNSGRNDFAVAVSEHALQTAELAFLPLDRSIYYIRKQLIRCLLEFDRYEAALLQIQLVLQTVYSLDFAKQHSKLEQELEIRTVRTFQLMALYRLNSLEFVTTVELLSEQARQSGNLWLLVPLYAFANILKRKHDFSTALMVSEN